MSLRVRFAPSPTGNVHIGNIRVAIFNWLYARHEGGRFLLRVEDTDRARSTPEAIENLLGAMAWLDLEADEPPVSQSERRAAHDEAVDRLIRDGHASRRGTGAPAVLHLHAGLFDPSFVTEPAEEAVVPVEKGALRADGRSLLYVAASAAKGEVVTPFLWDAMAELRLVLEGGDEMTGEALRARVVDALGGGEAPVEVGPLVDGRSVTALRFRRRRVFFDDLVLGRMEKPLDSLRDLVIARGDGSPVFHLANVVDDAFMAISHVLRGNDHVENTFRHLFLYRALGATPPRFAHFPMIVNEKGKPYSKRDGDAYVGDFRAKGLLPECLFNFLALCGWSPGDDREILTREEMVDAFTLERVNDAPARFNPEKLFWMNGQYLARMPEEAWLPRVRAVLAEEGIDAGPIDPAWLGALVRLQQEHVRTLREFVEASRYFFVDRVELQEKAVRKVLLKKNAAGLEALRAMRPVLAELPAWDEAALEEALTGFAQKTERKMGDVAQPLRVAVTGGTVSRGIWETLALLGRETTLARIDRVLGEVHAPEA